MPEPQKDTGINIGNERGNKPFRRTEEEVIRKAPDYGVDLTKARGTKLVNGEVVYTIGGVVVSKDEFFRKK